MIIEKKEKPHPISRKEKDFIVNWNVEYIKRMGRNFPKKFVEEACQFPPHRPFFNKILADDKGRIYVQKMKSILDKSKEFDFDIFGRDGVYLYKMKLPFSPDFIRNGYLFDIYSEEITGEMMIIRYKIKNWAEIKSENL